MRVPGTRLIRPAIVLAFLAGTATAGQAAADFSKLQQLDRKIERLGTLIGSPVPDYAAIMALGRDIAGLEPGIGIGTAGASAGVPVASGDPAGFEPEPTGKPGALSIIPIDLVLSQLSLQTGSNHHIELKEAQVARDAPVLVLRSGNWTLADLGSSLRQQGEDGILTTSGKQYRATLPIAIWPEAALAVSEGESLILDGSSGTFVVNSGLLRLEKAQLSGVGGNPKVNDFHPFVLTALGGRTLIDGSSLTGLGFGNRPHMRGVSFVSSHFFPRKTQALLRGSRFEDIRSVEFSDMDSGRIENNLILNATGSAIRIQRSKNSVVRANVVARSERHGITLSSGTSNAWIVDNVVADNAQAGLFSGGGVVSSHLSGNLVVGNAKSGLLLSGNGCVDLSNNIVAHNRFWGIGAKRSFNVSVSGNWVTRNLGPGLLIGESTFPKDRHKITGNRFTANLSGVSADEFVLIEMSGNDFSEQRPILFSGELQTFTSRYLSWSEIADEGKAPVFLASSAHAAARADKAAGGLAAFSVTELANCKP